MQLKSLYQSSYLGFTLVELMMVVTIIGVTSVFVIPNYTKAVSKSYEKAASNNLTILYSAETLSNNNGAGYQAGLTATVLNTNLGLSILPNGIAYSCAVGVGPSFNCIATYGGFSLHITQANPPTVCCTVANACPSVPFC